MNFLRKLFGLAPAVNYKILMENGGQIIDVRTKNEYSGGHIKGSLNIPLANIQNQLSKIKKDKPVITCCASGMRSGTAKSILKSKGYSQIYNGGSWVNLQNKIKH
jgi:phage shock protein E